MEKITNLFGDVEVDGEPNPFNKDTETELEEPVFEKVEEQEQETEDDQVQEEEDQTEEEEEEDNEDVENVKKLLKGLSAVRQSLTNKSIVIQEAPYLHLFERNGKVNFGVWTETVDFVLEQVPSTFRGTANINFKKLERVLRVLGQGNIYNTDNGDGHVKVSNGYDHAIILNTVIPEDYTIGDDLEDKISRVKEEGYKVGAKDYMGVLDYFTKIGESEKDEPFSDLVGKISFYDNVAVLGGRLYFCEIPFESPFEYQLDITQSEIIKRVLKSQHEDVDHLYIYNDSETDTIEIVHGNNYIHVYNVEKDVQKEQFESVKLFDVDEKVVIKTTQLQRALELSTIFLDRNGEEVELSVENGVGIIGEDNPEIGAGRGVFDATGVEDFQIRFSVSDMIRILGSQTTPHNEEIVLNVGLDDGRMYFETSVSKCVVSIYVADLDY